ncbi:polysaccharide biosynthesis protein [Sphingopyxis sp.]|jgi:FlaA1/EpsC-like NDP-sugar epimerase|uniref:polysaccharide biosynthesis protein n=1 Tax=Sphingopyxis sp. TaxID=1908224 RepID=UPI003F71529A
MIPASIVNSVLRWPRWFKRGFALSVDALLCVASVWIAMYLRVGEWPAAGNWPIQAVITSIMIALPIFIVSGLYRAIFRYGGQAAFVQIARAMMLYTVPFAIIYTFIGVESVPRTLGLIQPIVLFMAIASSRIAAQLVFQSDYTDLWRKGGLPRVLVYGAGQSGRELSAAIASSSEMRQIAFVDDDPSLWGVVLRGLPILSPADLPAEIERRQISDILLAIPSASRARRTAIIHELQNLKVHVRTLPSVLELARGTVSVSDLREPEIEDLLSRMPVPPDEALLRRNIEGKIVMVTGAGGSIGSELCRQIMRNNPAMLVLVDHAEFNLYSIHAELLRIAADADAALPAPVALLASVCDEQRMESIFLAWGPSTVIHAAAYKHVPLVEQNAVEGVRNNVMGTLTVARLAQRHGVESFVLISSDKAVRPTNIMGATKRFAELVLQALQEETNETLHPAATRTTFSMVRFGNVLGSSGSVIPLFREQIAKGGPVTITHKEITRYFMTVSEAAQLVLQAGAMARGGDVFLLDMGEPVRIYDLARNIIELSGLKVRDADSPDGEIEIRVTGLRPGEKLYEELLIEENPEPSEHPRIFRAREACLSWQELSAHLVEMTKAVEQGNAETARDLLRRIVPEFQPNSPLVDWTYRRRGTA